MESPEETVAVAAADHADSVPFAATVTAAVEATVELDGALQGWKKKEAAKNSRKSPGKKDVWYVAPDGEEIKTKTQMNKYLRAHPGTLTASDFEWGGPAGDAGELTSPATENRRRSARIQSKGRTSAEGVDEDTEPKQPVGKRSRKSRENGKNESNGAGKGESDIKAASENGIGVPSDISQDKEKENGEDNGETKAMDVDAPKVEVTAVEETREMAAEIVPDKSEDDKAVSEGINGEKPLDTLPEPSSKDATESKVETAPECNGHAEKPNEEAEIPPPHGIHAVVGGVSKSQGVEVAPEEVI